MQPPDNPPYTDRDYGPYSVIPPPLPGTARPNFHHDYCAPPINFFSGYSQAPGSPHENGNAGNNDLNSVRPQLRPSGHFHLNNGECSPAGVSSTAPGPSFQSYNANPDSSEPIVVGTFHPGGEIPRFGSGAETPRFGTSLPQPTRSNQFSYMAPPLFTQASTNASVGGGYVYGLSDADANPFIMGTYPAVASVPCDGNPFKMASSLPLKGKEKESEHVHRPTLDPLQAEILEKFFIEFAKLDEGERKKLRDRWVKLGRPAVLLTEEYLTQEAKVNSRELKPFHKLPPANEALTTKDIAYSHRLAILLGCLVELPSISVSLKNFTAYTIGPEPDRRPRTVLSGFYRWPCLRRTTRSDVLNDATVHFAPGGMHLIMGPPLSGKSAMLRALAGRLKGPNRVMATIKRALGKRALHVSGDMLENGVPKRLSKRNPLLYAEAAQYERHLPTLTVYETVDFANALRSMDLRKYKNPTSIERILFPIMRRLRSRNLLHLFGLGESAETQVGDGIVVRGVSGGQRRRVTSAEPLAALLRVILLDVPTNGLDTATAAEICRDLKILAYALRQTLVMALMQPPPEVFTLFTTVTMLDEGTVVYHGPIASAERYFRCLGFHRPEGVDLADYLIDMCTFRREKFFKGNGKGLKAFKVHETVSGRSWADGPAPDFSCIDLGLLKRRVKDDSKYSGWVVDRMRRSSDEDEGGNSSIDSARKPSNSQNNPYISGQNNLYNIQSNPVGTWSPPPPPMYPPQANPGMGMVGPWAQGTNWFGPVGSPSNGRVAMYQVDNEPPQGATVFGGPGQPPFPYRRPRTLFRRIVDRIRGREPLPGIAFNDPTVIAGTLSSARMLSAEEAANERGGSGGKNAQIDGHDAMTRDGLQALWKKSSLYTDTVNAIQKDSKIAAEAEKTSLYQAKWATKRLTQFKIIASRQWRVIMRTPAFFKGRVISALFIGIVLGTLFYGMPLTYEYAVARVGLLFFVAMSVGFGAMNNVGPWIKERQVFDKQHRLHFFHVLPYVAATTLTSLPTSIAEGLIMGTLVWWLCLPNPMFYRYIYFVIVLVLLSFMIACMMRLISAVSKTEVQGQALAVVIVLSLVVFCGFVLPVQKTPPWMVWIYWANPLKWALEAIAIIVLNKQTFYCPPDQLITVYEVPQSLSYIATDQGIDWSRVPPLVVVTNSTQTPTYTTSLVSSLQCPYTTGREALISIGFFHQEFWIFANMAILFGMALLMIIAAGFALKFIHFEEDHSERHPMQKTAAEEDLPPCDEKPLLWRGISYAVPVGGGWKTLLSNVSGYALPGTMTALMGESGAGKTTLMDVVSQRKLQGKAEGVIVLGEHDVSSGLPKDTTKEAGFTKPEVTFRTLLRDAVNGDKEAQKALRGKDKRRALMLFKASTGYVLQFDTLCPYETVRESVEFSAALRLVGVKKAERDERVDKCLKLLELEPVANVQIGGAEVSGVSDSQRKLTSIAVELVANPPVIFLDEPTTGLDPQGALVVVEALRRIADQGRAVLATIHQPSMRLFYAFDRLLLLKRGGRTVYFGPLHSKGPGIDVPEKFTKGRGAAGGAGSAGDAPPRTPGPGTSGAAKANASEVKQGSAREKRVEDCGTLTKYFERYDGVSKCGKDQNPASWMLDVIGAGASTSKKQDFAELWAKSSEGSKAKSEVDALIAAASPKAGSGENPTRQDIFKITPDKVHKHAERGKEPGDSGDAEPGTNPGSYNASTPYGGGTFPGLVAPSTQSTPPGSAAAPANSGPIATGPGLPAGVPGAPMPGGIAMAEDDADIPKIRPGYLTQLYWVSWRIWRMCWRAPNYSRQRVLISFILGLFFGFAYWRMERDTIGISALVGFVYMSMLFLIAMSAAMALPFWFAHKPCYNREVLGTRMYAPLVHGVALTLVDVFYVLATVVAFVGPAYWIINIGPRADTFWIYFLLIFLAVLWGTYFGQLLVWWKQTLPDAQMFFGLLMPLLTLFNGFIIKRTQIPACWIWVHYANPFRWLLEALVVTICKPIHHIDCSHMNNYDSDPMLIVDCPIKTGDEFIRSFGMWKAMQWPDVAIFAAFVVATRLLGFLALVAVKPPAT